MLCASCRTFKRITNAPILPAAAIMVHVEGPVEAKHAAVLVVMAETYVIRVRNFHILFTEIYPILKYTIYIIIILIPHQFLRVYPYA